MRTPKEYTENLQNHIITDDMLEAALFSVNKRAKNWRDKKREYKQRWYDKYHNVEKAEAEEKKMYAKKDKLLSQLEPICIHKEFAGYERVRVFDYQKEYEELFIREAFKGSIVHRNSFFKRGSCWEDDYWKDDYDDWDDGDDFEDRWVNFFDYEDRTAPTYRFYLFYRVGDHSFHTPISEQDAKKRDLPCFVIDTLLTTGEEQTDLMSVQFLDKMIDLINSGEYQRTGKSTEMDYVQTMQNEEKNRNKAKEHVIAKDEIENSIRRYWSDISPVIVDCLKKAYTPLKENITLTQDEKSQIEDSVKEKIRVYLEERNYSLIPNAESKRKSRIRRKLEKKHYYVDGVQIPVPSEFISISADCFSDDPGVTPEKLCDLYMSRYPDAFTEASKMEAQNDYIKRKEQSWKDQMISSMEKPA